MQMNSQLNAEQQRIAKILVNLHKEDYPANKMPEYRILKICAKDSAAYHAMH